MVGNGEVSTCSLLGGMGVGEVSSVYLSSPRWDEELPTCLLLGGVRRYLLVF